MTREATGHEPMSRILGAVGATGPGDLPTEQDVPTLSSLLRRFRDALAVAEAAPSEQAVAMLRRAASPLMDEFHVVCPYCGEESELYVEPDVHGTLVQDCEVCCNPWQVSVWWEDGERYVDVRRGDGS